MRSCHHCDIEMVESLDVKVEDGEYGIKISDGTGIFSKRIEKNKAAFS